MADPTQRDHVYWHELRSPVGTLVTLLDVASQTEGAPAELVDLLQRAKRQADRLAGMVAAAHDMERLKWGALVVHRDPLDLGAALRQAASTVEAAAKTRGVSLEVKPSAPLPLESDAVQLPRCLEVLLRAAVEASTRQGQVTAEVLARGDLAVARAEVARPVDAAALSQAFARESALGLRGGTALGLFEVKQLVEAMGGTAASEGLALELRLPRG